MHGDDRRTRLEERVVVFVVVAEQRLQLELGLLAGLDEQHLGAERLGDELDHLVGQRLRAGDHLARVEQQADEVGGGAVELGRELLDGAAALDDDLALGDRRVGRRELRHRRGTEILEVATTTLLAPGPLALRAGPTASTGTTAGTTGTTGTTAATAGTAGTAAGTLETATGPPPDRHRDAGSRRRHRRHRDAGSRRHRHRRHRADHRSRRCHRCRERPGGRAAAGCADLRRAAAGSARRSRCAAGVGAAPAVSGGAAGSAAAAAAVLRLPRPPGARPERGAGAAEQRAPARAPVGPPGRGAAGGGAARRGPG